MAPKEEEDKKVGYFHYKNSLVLESAVHAPSLHVLVQESGLLGAAAAPVSHVYTTSNESSALRRLSTPLLSTKYTTAKCTSSSASPREAEDGNESPAQDYVMTYRFFELSASQWT